MKRIPVLHSTTICSVLVAAALAGSTGCSSAPSAHATTESMGSFGVSTAKAKDSIDAAIKALETLVESQPADIKTQLDAYAKTLAALEEESKAVKGHADEMKANGDAFFKQWEDASATVSQASHAELSASYAKIKGDMGAARDEFTPLLESLKDIESYLRLDPSSKGLESVAPLVKTAKDNATKVKSSIDAVLQQVNSVRGMLKLPPE